MGKVYAEGYAEFWVGFSLTGDPEVMYSALGWVNTGVTANDFTQAVVDEIMQLHYNCFVEFVPSAYTLNQSFALVGLGTSATDDDPPLKIASLIPPEAGAHTGATDSLPQNNAWLVRKNVTLGKPGRMFIPGVDETKVSNTGTINSTELGLRQLDLTGLVAAVEAVEVGGLFLAPAMMSKNRAPLVGYEPKVINSLSLDNRIATQRRRLRR